MSDKRLPLAKIITRRDIRRRVIAADYLAAVEVAFQAAAMGKAGTPMPMHFAMTHGTFHAKGGSLALGRDYVAVKVNANFPQNPEKHGLPTIQGAILFFDGGSGSLLAIVDSSEVTIQRTAAASALAAKHLAREDSSRLLICGCGEQGRAHVEMLREVLPIEHILLWDRDPARSDRLAAETGGEAVTDLAAAAKSADVIVTCTPATEPYLQLEMVRPGTFVAAVGADNPGKSEIAPQLMAAAKVITDVTAQAASMGDLHHAIAAGLLTRSDVHAELGQMLTGARAGRSAPDEIIVFDSTGTGLQDVAAVATIYERCSGDDAVRSVALSAA